MAVKGESFFILLLCMALNYAEQFSSDEVLSVLYGKTCTSFMMCPEGNGTNEVSTNIIGNDEHSETFRKCCLYCSCDVNVCHKNHDCCQGTVAENATEIQRTTTCTALDISIDFHQKDTNEIGKGNLGSIGVIMISYCANEFKDERCESPDVTSLDETLPRTDPLTGEVYRNVYCATCNNVTDTTPWLTFVTCSERTIVKSDAMLFPQTFEKIYRFSASSSDAKCGVYFQHPSTEPHNTELCLLDLYQQNATETINDTCDEQFYAKPYPENDFVGLLNIGDSHTKSTVPDYVPTDLTPAILVPSTIQCNSSFVYDPYMEKCRRWYCPNGYQFIDSRCVPVFTSFVRAQLSFRLQIRPENRSMHLFVEYNKTDLVHAVVDGMFGKHVEKRIILIDLKRDKSFVYTFILLTVDEDADIHQAIYNASTFDKKLSLPGENGTLHVQVGFATGMKIEVGTFYLTDIIIFDLNDFTGLTNILRVDLVELEKVLKYPNINKMTFCSQIVLDRSEVRDYVDIIDIIASDIRLRPGEFIQERTSNGLVFRICLSDYLREAESHLLKKPEDVVYSPQAILSVICNMLSMVGLLATLVTYMIFDELRSIPGKNNIMLALHLLVAQIFYQFGMDQTQTPKLCIAFGVFIHLFWLTAILWMNACTLHMFRTFVTGQSYRSVRALDPQVLYYTLYCYSVAITMVAINIGVSLYRSDGKEYGYGGHVCYISDPVMVGWVFALPVGVIIILNMGFFFAVVYQISASTMRRRGKSSDRANTIIYMKLSSLTGVTWIFGYLYMWTNFAPLEYIFIVLNAGQGVLIFISFICTKRILKLYWNLMRKHARSCRVNVCSCVRKSPLSETNGVDVNTAKISLSGSSRSKGMPMIGRFSQRQRKKSQKFAETRNHSERLYSNSLNDSSDIFQQSMNIARCLSNPAFESTAKMDRQGEMSEDSLADSNGIHSMNGIKEPGNDTIATVCQHQIDVDLAN